MTADTLPCDLITLKQAARLANNTHCNTVRRWIRKGRLAAYRIGDGRAFYVSRADIMTMVRRVPIEPNPFGAGPSRLELQKRSADVMEELKRRGAG